ncbi:MAG: SufD family Fe-S cluster assembly protein [Eubacteriales bacterium]|nr:SufD family Fe-S cluster assembly protein [Eubacteriales bacterium]
MPRDMTEQLKKEVEAIRRLREMDGQEFTGTLEYTTPEADDIIPVSTFRHGGVNKCLVPELSFAEEAELHRLVLKAGDRLLDNRDYQLDAEHRELNERLEIRAETGSDSELIFAYRDSGEVTVKRQTDLHIEVAPGAKLMIFLLQQMSPLAASRMKIHCLLEPESELRLVIADSGAGSHALDLKTELDTRSLFDCQSIYFGRGQEKYDYNYHLIHHGQLAQSKLQVNGALMDHAEKVFRGTIDFRRGSSGSVGDESEYVTLLDDTVRSRAIPLLLSGEDNVEGNHAASAGRLDPAMVFYVQSRGFNRREAEKMIIASRFSNVLDILPNSELKDSVLKDILEKLDSAK